VRTSPSLSPVALVEQPQPDQRQPRLHLVDHRGLGGHQRRQLAGRHHHGLAAELGPNPPDQPFHQRDVAEHGAREQRADGVAPDDRLRPGQLDALEPRGVLEQRLGGQCQAGRNNGAGVGAVGGHHVERRRRVKVDDDGRAAVQVLDRDGVDDPIGPELAGLLGGDPDAGPRARPDHQRIVPEQPVADLLEDAGQRRHHRGDSRALHLAALDALLAQEAVKQHGVLVGGAADVRSQRERRAQLRTVEDAGLDAGVADVERREHAPLRPAIRPLSSGQKTSLAGESPGGSSTHARPDRGHITRGIGCRLGLD
jgi:hypothetical protein